MTGEKHAHHAEPHEGPETHGSGHDKHAGHSVSKFRDRFWLSLALSIPVVFFSETIQGWFGYNAPAFTGSDWLAPVLGTVIFVYGGAPFLKGAVAEARHREPGMMLLIGMAISVAFVASWTTTLGLFDLEFWWELAALITVMLLGHWMEMRAIGQARGALDALAELLPDEAEKLVGGVPERVAVSDLAIGDTVLVRPGGRVPADGTVVDGQAEIDVSMVTGESNPVLVLPDDRVVAGTVSTDSAIQVEVTAVGEDTTVAGIRRLVEQAQASSSRAQLLADRAAAWLFYIAVGAGALTLLIWSLAGEPDEAIVRTVAVLVIACPHALGLAIPLVVSISTGIAARNGILVKDRRALEEMRRVEVVLFDKTGTLTRGAHRVREVVAVDGDEDRLLAAAAAAEAQSEHPLGRAIVIAAEGLDVPDPESFTSISGRGVEAVVGEVRIAVGGPRYLAENSLEHPESISDSVAEWEERGDAVLYVVEAGSVSGAISLADEVRPESREAVRALQRQGVEVALVTGDASQVAVQVGRELGIETVYAEVPPEEKHSKVEELQASQRVVAMVGDGVNDAPALARADVGIAIGAGTDVAIESAGVVLVSDDPRGVVAVRRLSYAGYRKMQQNLLWAAGYNVAAIPLAAGVLAWAGIVLGPAVGAALMSTSTVIVALNAQLLRSVDLGVGA